MQEPADGINHLLTRRLVLREFTPQDAPVVEPLLGDWEVAATSTIPHPYPAGAFVKFVRVLAEQRQARTNFGFAIVPSERDIPIGSMNLLVDRGNWGLAYWIGRPYWGMGYATEAGERVVRFGFEDIGARAIVAGCLSRNVGSIRVLEKLGFDHREHRPASILHHGIMEDGEAFVLTADAWRAQKVDAAR